MKSFYHAVAIAFTAVTLAVPAAAQRELDVPSEVAWTHPHSGLEMPNSLGGLPRINAVEFAPDLLNLGFSYEDKGEALSVYIYRDTNGGVPVWFEQARIGIETRNVYGKPKLPFSLEAYGWPGAERWQGQRAIYATPKSSVFQSTGLALFSIEGWFVKLRASSSTRSAEELGAWMDEAFAEMTPPASDTNQPQSLLVVDCAEKLEFKKKAKDAKRDAGAGILGALLGGIQSKEVEEDQEDGVPQEAVQWCFDSAMTSTQKVYRANASTDSYLIALGDSGMGVSVYPDLTAALFSKKPEKAPETFAVTVITDSQRINFTPQNRLPSYKRVLELINKNRRTSSVSTWGDDSTITVNPDTLK